MTKTGGDARANSATIFESHPKQRVRQNFFDDTCSSRIVLRSSPPFRSVFERCENAAGDLLRRSDPINSAKQPEFFVMRQERRGHCVVLIETLFDRFRLVIGPMFELGVRGRGTIL